MNIMCLDNPHTYSNALEGSVGTIQACISHMPIHALEGLMHSLEESVGSLDREQAFRDPTPLHHLSPLGQQSSHFVIKHSLRN